MTSGKNPYPGINPHLNSALLLPGDGWSGFHADHIAHLRETLDTLLPDNYYAVSETSLQVATYDEAKTTRTTLIPDVAVYRTTPGGRESPEERAVLGTILMMPVLETLDEIEELGSVVIYELQEGTLPGRPVTRIELLSPANKYPGSHSASYLVKRSQALYSGLCLVEMDYIHERRPIIRKIPSYPDRQPGAYPYHVLITNPQPNIAQALTEVHRFDILSPLPALDIPLAGKDSVRLDFGAVYQRTFESARLFQILADYTKEPVNFDAYTPEDQERIRAFMAQLKSGQDTNQ